MELLSALAAAFSGGAMILLILPLGRSSTRISPGEAVASTQGYWFAFAFALTGALFTKAEKAVSLTLRHVLFLCLMARWPHLASAKLRRCSIILGLCNSRL